MFIFWCGVVLSYLTMSNATPPETSCNGFIFKSHHFFFTFFVQLYCFEDRGNRRVALRPELTPSLARLVIQKGYLKSESCCFCIWIANVPFYAFLYPNLIVLDKNLQVHLFIFLWFCIQVRMQIWSPCFFWSRKSLSLPLKWFAIGQCWRYERMTRGRRREHYQWNMDIIGVPEVTVSASELALHPKSVSRI